MSEDQINSIMEEVCEICHFPWVCTKTELEEEHCINCPVEQVLHSIEKPLVLKCEFKIPADMVEKEIRRVIEQHSKEVLAT